MSKITKQWCYIVFVALITGYILNQFTIHVTNFIGLPPNHYLFEYELAFGQIIWQGIAIQFFSKKQRLVYLVNMSSVSLIGSILLLPLILTHQVFQLPESSLIAYFFLVVSYMIIDHLRRCKLLGLPIYITFSWVCFRLVALGILLL